MTSVAILRMQQGARDDERRRSEKLLAEADRVNREARELAQRLRNIANEYRDRLVNRRAVR